MSRGCGKTVSGWELEGDLVLVRSRVELPARQCALTVPRVVGEQLAEAAAV